MSIRILLVIVLGLAWTMPAWSIDYRCSREAKNLRYAADEYESALSDLENAKESYESACNSDYGYSVDDPGACGRSGYERSEYESALNDFESALEDLKAAYEAVTRRCEPPNYQESSPASACFLMLTESKKELAKCRADKEPATGE